MATRPNVPELAPQILVDELLGFSPHLLLDDMIDAANTAVGQAVEAMEKQLERWAAAYNTTATTPNSSGKKRVPLTAEEQEQEHPRVRSRYCPSLRNHPRDLVV